MPIKLGGILQQAKISSLETLLAGGTHESLETIQGILSGTFEFRMNGQALDLIGLDFSSITQIEEAALVLQVKLREALEDISVTYLERQFVITSPTTGVNSSVSVATGDAAEALGLSASKHAKANPGLNAQTLVNLEALNAGEIGNDLDLSLNLFGEETPKGLTLSLTAMSGGLRNQDIKAMIENIAGISLARVTEPAKEYVIEQDQYTVFGAITWVGK